MDERDKLLESIGFDVSDGRDLDWSAFEGSAEIDPDQEEIQNLRTLSKIAGYYRNLRQQDQASGRDTHQAPPALDRFDASFTASSTRMWGHLAIAETIGSGTYGDVYRARDTRLNRDVALKLVHPCDPGAAAASDYLREARLLAKVSHPNLATIHGADIRDGRVGLWMEFVDGVTLHDLIADHGSLNYREAALLGIDLCGALAAVHKQGLIHRDIKAHNIMREKGGRFILMDFGSARSIRGDESDKPIDIGLSGTPMYMAPEVVAGADADVRSEIYSLGVLLYYTVANDYPVTARNLAQLRLQHIRGEYQRLRDLRPDLPTRFIVAVEKALTPDPAQRYASAGEMEEALTSALGVDSTTTTRQGSPSAAGDALSKQIPVRGRVRYWLAGAFCAVLIIAAVLWSGLFGALPYTITAELHRVAPNGSELLLPGARVAPGDQLYLDFEASRDLYVYILAEDDNGEAYLLFPLPGHDQTNPLPGDQRHHLPPSLGGSSYNWGVSSAGGTEHLLIVASPQLLADFEKTISVLPAPISSPPAQAMVLDENAMKGLRGIGQLIEAKSEAAPHAARPAFSMARRLAAGPEQGSGVWVRQIDLINP